MKSLLFAALVGLIFCANTSYAQKSITTRAGHYRWIYSYTSFGQLVSEFVDTISTDSVFDSGRYYRKFANYLIRDSSYLTYAKVAGNGSEFLLMDLRLNVGDTLRTNDNGRSITIRIMAKYKVKIEGDSLWRLNIQDANNPNSSSHFSWIESLGNIGYQYFPIVWTKIYGVYDAGYTTNCILDTHYMNILNSLGRSCLANNFLLSNKKWIGWESNDMGDHKSTKIFQDKGLKEIAGKTYHIMGSDMELVRYDSIEKKYFIYKGGSPNEAVIFDENANLGDTISMRYQYPDTVKGIELKQIGGRLRKFYQGTRYQYATGIGSLNSILWNTPYATFPEYWSGALCYLEDDIDVYHYSDYYTFKLQSCEIPSSIHDIYSSSISLFPNPCSEILYSNSKELKSFVLSDFMGRVVLEGTFRDRIDMTNIQQGIYHIQITIRDISYIQKIIKL